MKKFVKILVILGLVLCLCGGIVTAAGYIGGGFRELTVKASSSMPAVQSTKAQESLTFSPDEIGRLEFRLNSENIAFRPSDDGQIHIRYIKRDDVTYTAYQEQSAASDGLGTLVFTRKDVSTGTQLFHFGMEFDEDTADVQVALPKGLSVDVFTDFMYQGVYYNPIAKGEERKVQNILGSIWEYYVRHIDELPAVYQSIAEEEGAQRAVCDYVSGMTDSYALEVYSELFIPAAWTIK